MATPDYHEATRYVAPLALSTWLFVANKPVSWSLTQGRRTGLLSTLHGFSMALLLIGLLVFLGALGMGIMGVILATIIANLFALVAGYLISRAGFRLILPWGRLAGMVALILGGGLALSALEPAGIDVMGLLAQSALLIVIVVITSRLAGIRNPKRLLQPSGR
jgi:O-antigen/teichoic acid export membrane protein